MTQSTLPTPTAEDRARGRFFTAASGHPPTDEQRAGVAAINAAVVALAVEVERHTPKSRNQSLALTAREDVSMRANLSIFTTGPTACYSPLYGDPLKALTEETADQILARRTTPGQRRAAGEHRLGDSGARQQTHLVHGQGCSAAIQR
ncbi:hypothetical protein IFU40_13585 [Microbacterium sp. CFBP 13617]|uniref:Acb2/Tad1 domain-containing protein n=1 Tax=Microbacterium sp. CFBP 13617 TaxID=2774035 RepID=UPI001783B409|nr:hypothetical protein [Microbacterium sp. CFBP 13617]MBD8219665.1 hypothetical protein [Microbacterium sp. CFBP 13617]